MKKRQKHTLTNYKKLIVLKKKKQIEIKCRNLITMIEKEEKKTNKMISPTTIAYKLLLKHNDDLCLIDKLLSSYDDKTKMNKHWSFFKENIKEN